ncbi:MAG: hypothetical protein RL280_1282, partial [Actinomycetota bacterium]
APSSVDDESLPPHAATTSDNAATAASKRELRAMSDSFGSALYWAGTTLDHETQRATNYFWDKKQGSEGEFEGVALFGDDGRQYSYKWNVDRT